MLNHPLFIINSQYKYLQCKVYQNIFKMQKIIYFSEYKIVFKDKLDKISEELRASPPKPAAAIVTEVKFDRVASSFYSSFLLCFFLPSSSSVIFPSTNGLDNSSPAIYEHLTRSHQQHSSHFGWKNNAVHKASKYRFRCFFFFFPFFF